MSRALSYLKGWDGRISMHSWFQSQGEGAKRGAEFRRLGRTGAPRALSCNYVVTNIIQDGKTLGGLLCFV